MKDDWQVVTSPKLCADCSGGELLDLFCGRGVEQVFHALE